MDLDRNGPLTRVTGFVYRMLAVEAAFVVATAPALIGILLLDRHPSNIPLYGALALFFGPAIAAGTHAWRGDEDLVPWLRFWKSWIESLGQSLVVWVPVTALATLTVFNAAFADVAAGFLLVGGVLGAAAVVVGVVLLIVVGDFRFRSRDLFGVAMHGIASAPMTAVGVISLAVLAAGIVLIVSDWALVLLASLMLLALARTARPMLAGIHRDLVAHDGDDADLPV